MSEEIKLHAPVKPFDHRPEKRGADGRIISAKYYSTHIVNGVSFLSFYDKPSEFYHQNGQPIPFDEVPEICKRNLSKVTVPKPTNTAIIKSSKSEAKAKPGEADSDGFPV